MYYKESKIIKKLKNLKTKFISINLVYILFYLSYILFYIQYTFGSTLRILRSLLFLNNNPDELSAIT